MAPVVTCRPGSITIKPSNKPAYMMPSRRAVILGSWEPGSLPQVTPIVQRCSTASTPKDRGRMPHIGSRVVDEKGVRLIRDWIVSLPARSGLDAEAALGQKLDDKNA